MCGSVWNGTLLKSRVTRKLRLNAGPGSRYGTGAPALGIDVSVAPDGLFDPSSGTAVVHGSATCSRPARIVVSGSLLQGHDKAQGAFQATIICAGVTAWNAEVAPDQGHRGRFAGGPATTTFTAVGVPDDNQDDTANDAGILSIHLRRAPPH